MGSGLVGGPLTGSPPTGSNIAPAGQSAILAGPLGASSGDVVTKIGSTVADGSVNAAAKLTSFRTGIGGTEVEKAYINKLGAFVGGAVSATTMDPAVSPIFAKGAAAQSAPFVDVRNTGNTPLLDLDTNGRLNVYFGGVALYGTDSTGAPGNATIDKPSGKSAIALGAASVTITCSVCAATSRVMITPHARDATCKEIIVVPGAGSFVVSGSAAATAAVPFSWEVATLL